MLPAPKVNVGDPILLTDGTILLQEMDSYHNGTGTWIRVAPDQNGSYVNATWLMQSTMPAGYAPLWHAAAVLPDGRVLIEGGKYNYDQEVETNLGAIYDPVSNTWTAVGPPGWPPPGPPYTWPSIGDAQSVVLPNGTLMLGNCCYTEDALFDASHADMDYAFQQR